MTTTTGRDLLARAESLSAQLARCDQPTTTAAWESFDATAYRLLREVIGPGRTDTGTNSRVRARLLRVIHSYPTPLRPPLDTELSATAAARFAPVSNTQFREQLQRGEINAEWNGKEYTIHSRHLDRRPDIAPADSTDAHPLARLSTALGALADLVSQERLEPQAGGVLDDEAALDVTARLLSYASVAARYTLRHGPAVDGQRPLAIAQYAERFIDTLGVTTVRAPLEDLAARVATSGHGLPERLDSALHRWAAITDGELTRTIPPTQVMANTAELGAMMLAALHHLDGTAPGVPRDKTQSDYLRKAADSLKAAAAIWKAVTTLQPQTREFGSASMQLFKVMHEIIETPAKDWPERNVSEAVRSLQRGVRDLTRFIGRSNEATRACLNSRLLFAPARALTVSHERLSDRRRGSYVAATPKEAHELMGTIAESLEAVKEVSRGGLRSIEAPLPLLR